MDQRGVVFPTSVGVFLSSQTIRAPSGGLPHVRGGVSTTYQHREDPRGSSPRPWGCFPIRTLLTPSRLVFPTSVGVFLICFSQLVLRQGLPHVRGGVSDVRVLVSKPKMSSPRPWGCFSENGTGWICRIVFPTSVGVFPLKAMRDEMRASLPHVRGGVSPSKDGYAFGLLSSPRPWGCFSGSGSESQYSAVFPTSVGVFPHSLLLFCRVMGLPHVRGGVSVSRGFARHNRASSPRPWGCFQSRSASARS